MSEKKWIATPSRTGEILDRYGLKAKKNLGQNFLMEPGILENMLALAQVDKSTDVIEVGPGIGALTEFLVTYANRVVTYEVDTDMINVLHHELGGYDNLTIINEDFLKTNLQKDVATYLPGTHRLVVLANLPYYITTPIIFHCLESGVAIEEMVLMVQYEVAERLTAHPNTKAYGASTVELAYYAESILEQKVPNTVFRPRPKVDSALLHLIPYTTPPVHVDHPKLLFKVIKGSFSSRRKTLWNNLKMLFGKDEATKSRLQKALDESDIDGQRRAETLTLEEFAVLTQNLEGQDFQ